MMASIFAGRMRWAALPALVLLAPMLAGCLSFLEDDAGSDGPEPPQFEYDPEDVSVASVVQHDFMLSSFDGVELAVSVYEPVSHAALPNGSAMQWPTILFLHGWGQNKGNYQNFRLPGEDGNMQLPFDILERFAMEGFIVAAFDARGFGQSSGQTAFAGPAEQADLAFLIDYLEGNFSTNGLFGMTGISYGGGQSLLWWAKDPRVVTVVPHSGWVDAFHGLVPGGVPKMEWVEALYAAGIAGSRARYDPIIHEWYRSAYTREGFDAIESAMDFRSAGGLLAATDKPLFVCQPMQETLFPQADQMWEASPGFVRTYIFTGGHGNADPECWDRTLSWFQFFLAGIDTGVDEWPALTTVDARGDRVITYASIPQTTKRDWFLHHNVDGFLTETESKSTFTVEQRVLANPFSEPSALWDITGAPNNAIPEQFRQDPTALFFETQPLGSADVIFGAPRLHLDLADNASAPFQVTASLFLVSDGRSTTLSRTAHAVLEGQETNTTITLRFPWVKADVEAGDVIQLKLAANDPSMFMPLFENYAVTFEGSSSFHLPLADL